MTIHSEPYYIRNYRSDYPGYDQKIQGYVIEVIFDEPKIYHAMLIKYDYARITIDYNETADKITVLLCCGDERTFNDTFVKSPGCMRFIDKIIWGESDVC